MELNENDEEITDGEEEINEEEDEDFNEEDEGFDLPGFLGGFEEEEEEPEELDEETLMKCQGFHFAAETGNLPLLQQLSTDPAVKINWKNGFGFTPLSVACQRGHLEVVRFLLGSPDLKPDVNRRGETPFGIACQGGHVEIIKLLMADERVDVNYEDGDKWTPFMYACRDGLVELVKLLLTERRIEADHQGNNFETGLSLASQDGHVEIVKILLATDRIHVNQVTDLNQSPFHLACQQGHSEVVKIFLADERVDLETTDYFSNFTPLEEASWRGHPEVVKLILASGRPLDLTNVDRVIEVADSVPQNNENEYWETEEEYDERIINAALIAELLRKFQRDKIGVRLQLRAELGMNGELFHSFHSTSSFLFSFHFLLLFYSQKLWLETSSPGWCFCLTDT